MEVKVGVSNRHIHITKEDFYYLFEEDILPKEEDLSQIGEYKSKYKVSIEGPKGIINNVRIVGPFRSYTQVEVSKTDCYKLGVKANYATSGDLSLATSINIINNDKKLTRKSLIMANRHIHISNEDIIKYNLNKPYYKVKINNIKGGILDHVYIKPGNYNFELHLDTDDANAFDLKTGDKVSIIE